MIQIELSKDTTGTPPDEVAIRATNLGKRYQFYDSPRDRLKQFIVPRLCRTIPALKGFFTTQNTSAPTYYREFCALDDISFEIRKGEAIGIVGRNGAGKSTLLQILCGTLTPSSGVVEIYGRVAALLELGAGFNPEFTGRENVYLNASVLGLSADEIEARFDDIVSFADIGIFIDQPVKTYSSGMFVRLAFSVATSVCPDILVIDEALSVGDGDFSRKSFDRIMQLKEQGTTILFCSHALYQTEAFCDRVIWIDRGRSIMCGPPNEVVHRYSASLLGADQVAEPGSGHTVPVESDIEINEPEHTTDRHDQTAVEKAPVFQSGQARFTAIRISMDGVTGTRLRGYAGKSDLSIQLEFICDPSLPIPTVGVTLDYGSLLAVTCVSSRSDRIQIFRDSSGRGKAEINFPKLALRKGSYLIGVYLGCESALHFYEASLGVAQIEIEDSNPEPGLVTLPHNWICTNPLTPSRAVPVHGSYLMEVDKYDSLGLIHNNGVFEAGEVAVCRLLINEGERVLDIGANIGYYTLLFASLVSPSGRVFAIEPDISNFELLQTNIDRNVQAGLVDTFQLALGNEIRSTALYRSATNNGMHRLYVSVCCTEDSSQVPVVTGDSLNLGQLDFIKIDIEGFEPAALQGLSDTIKNSPNLKILCEFSPLSICEAGFSPSEFLQSMKDKGFHLFCQESDKWQETQYSVLLKELEKIPLSSVNHLVNSFSGERSIQIITQKASEFLTGHGYARPLLENIVFVASTAVGSLQRLRPGYEP